MIQSLCAAGPADAAKLSAFAAASFVHTFGHLYRPQDLSAFLAQWNQPEDIARQIADPQWHVAQISFADGNIAGFIKLGPVEFDLPDGQPLQDAAELHQLYVHEDAKGTGVAAALMDYGLQWARQRAVILYLSVFSENFRAQSFYVRYGFGDVGRNPFKVGEQIDEDRIWRLDL